MQNFELNLHNKNLSDEEIFSDIKKVVQKLSQSSVSMRDYSTYGSYNVRNIAQRFDNWNNALRKAGLDPVLEMNLTDEALYKNIQDLWVKLGRQPTMRELKKPDSKYSQFPYRRRFGSWNNALQSFVKYVNTTTVGTDEVGSQDTATVSNIQKEINVKRTTRSISDRLRFRILMRDGFTCAKCGRSPLKERDVELHVDHIKPWSKGGETISENLETNCSKCNLGKGNAFDI